MLYLIGLGLNEKSLGKEAIEAIKKCHHVYLESYTVEFPYQIETLEKEIGKKIIKLERKDVEDSSNKLIKEARKEDIALLVYGSPLFATTHLSLILEAKKQKPETKVKIIYNASVFDAIGETGLELYKFGKITSLPDWKDKGKTIGFTETIKQNLSINAHTLILVDIGLDFQDALKELEESIKTMEISLKKIIVGSCLGTDKSKLIYGSIEHLQKQKNIKAPFCFIIPCNTNNLHFTEKEALENLN